MKNLNFTLVFITTLFFCNVQSQSIISIEHQDGSSSFTHHLDSAIILAQNGDFIYVPGGSFSTGTVTINKGISIIGVGHYPDSTVATNQTIITSDITIAEGADNLHLEGLFIMGNISMTSLDIADNVLIKKCNVGNITSNGSHFSQFQNDSTFSENWQIIHNVVRNDINFANIKSFNLHGNIINGILHFAFAGGIMENNIFLANPTNQHSIDEIRNCTVKNNIFLQTWELDYAAYACYNPPCGSFNNIFLNNSFCFAGQNAYLENGLTVVSSNNKFDALASDIFQNVSGNVFNYAHNYHLTSTFSSLITGNDGLEIGVYGSTNPYKEGAVPFNPHIQTKSIATGTTANGLLNVNIKVNAQDN